MKIYGKEHTEYKFKNKNSIEEYYNMNNMNDICETCGSRWGLHFDNNCFPYNLDELIEIDILQTGTGTCLQTGTYADKIKFIKKKYIIETLCK